MITADDDADRSEIQKVEGKNGGKSTKSKSPINQLSVEHLFFCPPQHIVFVMIFGYNTRI
jgi:hypothetical protein